MSNDPFTLDIFGNNALSSGLGLGVTAFASFAPEAANDDDPDPTPPVPALAMRPSNAAASGTRKQGNAKNFYFEDGEDRGLAASWKERARIRDAIDRNDLPAAMAYALSNRETKLEIDGFNQAVTERFGERTLLSNAAREPSGKLYERLSEGMKPEQKEQLKQAWPVMRTAQQLAAHERTVQSLKVAEEQRLTQRQTPVMKQ